MGYTVRTDQWRCVRWLFCEFRTRVRPQFIPFLCHALRVRIDTLSGFRGTQPRAQGSGTQSPSPASFTRIPLVHRCHCVSTVQKTSTWYQIQTTPMWLRHIAVCSVTTTFVQIFPCTVLRRTHAQAQRESSGFGRTTLMDQVRSAIEQPQLFRGCVGHMKKRTMKAHLIIIS